MRLGWLRRALRNSGYIAADDPAAARLVVKCVLDAVAQLAAQPGLGRPGRVTGSREWVVTGTRYIAPYRERGDTLEVLLLFHASRRPPGRW